MTTPRPIALTDSQLALVIDAADSLPSNWRSRFLEAIADRLLMIEDINNRAVVDAIDLTLRRIGVAA
jgi:hypothetical protein